jgi:GGDEF domain-containing protein
LVCLSLQAFGVVDLPDMILFIHGCAVLVVFYALFHSIRHFFVDRHFYRRISFTTVSMMIMLVCSTVDLYRYYFTTNEDYSKYSRVGFLLYLGCTGLGMIFRSVQLDRTNKELEQLAYIDYETGVLNRSAFIKYVEETVTQTLAFVAVEVLELKEIASSFGTVGKNEVIKSAAKMIEVAFSNYGKIFRIAEAQFLIVLEAEVEKSYQHGMEILRKRVQNSNKSRGINFYLGDNYILYQRDGEQSLETILEELEVTLHEMKKIKETTIG